MVLTFGVKVTVVIVATVCLVTNISVKGQNLLSKKARIDKVSKSIANPLDLESIGEGTKPVPIAVREAFERTIPASLVSEVKTAANSNKAAIEEALRQDSKTTPAARASVPFGPHLLVNPKALEITRTGSSFAKAGKTAAQRLKLGRGNTCRFRGIKKFQNSITCPFGETISCDRQAKYRTQDGSCNNLLRPYWGRANTPFERFLSAAYEDGFDSPRSLGVSGSPLPLARLISTQIHSASSVADLHPDINHMTMQFGQLISHEFNQNTLSTGSDGGRLTCCLANGAVDPDPAKEVLGCLHIEIPTNDPFFWTFGRTCMNFVRAAASPDLNCDLCERQQLNQVTHYIDGSTVYGSDVDTMMSLRTFTDGLLKSTASANGPLLLQTGSPCNPTSAQQCFKAGDSRAMQQPSLTALHTIFLREHNRVVTALKANNPTWNDEKLFQEGRKIVGAELQHITYSEYLFTILGDTFANAFGFAPKAAGYFTGYKQFINPAIRNSFVAGAYRFAHSTVRDNVINGELFKDHFINPTLIYNPGPSAIVSDLITNNQQDTDNLMTSQLTNHLFERAPGRGADLAATNIQRGRDHGIAGYNEWRVWCGLEPATTFNDLIDHETSIALLLSTVYENPADIDLWTGVVTETPLEGKAVGPTGACIIGRQFWIQKHGDRFYYEGNRPFVRFRIAELNEIRKTSLARIICDNTDLTQVSANAFDETSDSNRLVPCSSIPSIDLTMWT